MDKFGILHVCSIKYRKGDGMVNVIPEHVKNQNRYADTVLINLQNKRFELDTIPSFNYGDYKRYGLKTLLQGIQIDIVVIHGIYQPNIIKFWKRHIKDKIPYVVIPHGAMSYGLQKKGYIKKTIFNHLFSYHMCRNSAGIQFLSEDEKRNSKKSFYRHCFVQSNGIYLPKQHKEFSKQKKEFDIRILYIGRYDEYHKGLDLLLLACCAEQDFMRNHHIYIDMYGRFEDSDINKVKTFVDLKRLNDIIKLHDGVYGRHKENKFLECDYFIHTSRLEGMPMSILEAFSYGIPVLVTDKTNAGCDVKKYKNGFVEKTSIEGIRSLLHDAVDHLDALEEMSAYSVAKKTVEKYKQLSTAQV